MRYITLFFIFSAAIINYKQTEPVDIKILVTNIKTHKGNIEIGVFNTSNSFLHIGKEYKTYSKKVTKDTLTFILNGFQKDNYAISLYHDKNSDKKCNLNFLGIPLEPFGFSKNYRPKFAKPKFDDCKINVHQNMTIIIELIN